MWSRLKFLLNRLGERLWLKPLLACVLSIAGAFLAKLADNSGLGSSLPDIAPASTEALLSISASSMLVIATLAVTSMVSAYASAAAGATPRSFSLLVADRTSQNALSTFLGAFIYSIVALIASKNNYYEAAGNFLLFSITVFVLTMVVITFVGWVDWIARLGRIGTTVDKVEAAAASSLRRRRLSPALDAKPVTATDRSGTPVFGEKIGYVQHINVESLQSCADANDISIHVAALPGTFVSDGTPLAYIEHDDGNDSEIQDESTIAGAFHIGNKRVFDDDPRFGLIALSEIASRALSPAVNDPGTAIEIIGVHLRLFASLIKPLDDSERQDPVFDRIRIPRLDMEDLFDDAFRPIARDGASILEVQVRLQKAFASLAALEDSAVASAATKQSRRALERAKKAMTLADDFDAVADAAAWSAK